MRRVVVTGLGIVSSIGNNADEVQRLAATTPNRASASPRNSPSTASAARCGARRRSIRRELDRPPRHALPVARAARGTMSPWSRRSPMPASSEDDITNERTGIIMGSGGPSTRTIVEAADITRKNNSPKRIGPFAVPKAMSSTASATLATWFKIHGVNYSISSACSTSAHCIGNAYELIQFGKQDIIFAGGHEDLDWTMSNLFDAMGAMSSKFNDRARGRLARLRRRPRRLRHRRRRRRAGAGGARARQGARRQDLRRDRRLRRDLRRLRHGGAVRRRRGALHAAGAGHRRTSRSTTSTRTAPRRRSAIPRRWARSARCSATTCRTSRRPSR